MKTVRLFGDSNSSSTPVLRKMEQSKIFFSTFQNYSFPVDACSERSLKWIWRRFGTLWTQIHRILQSERPDKKRTFAAKEMFLDAAAVCTYWKWSENHQIRWVCSKSDFDGNGDQNEIPIDVRCERFCKHLRQWKGVRLSPPMNRFSEPPSGLLAFYR
jgi:hypothetical protein